jgi:regulator of sigma E protease
MSIILFIIILGILIFVHELGHFLVAKKSGIRVDEFAIGFPPKLLSITRGGTKYALNLIPFGGYVKIFGENPDEESLSKDSKDSFVNKSKLTQAAVLIAGVLFNTLFAWLLFAVAFMIGFDVRANQFSFVDNPAEVQILEVSENSPAFSAGLEEGDVVHSLTKDGSLFSLENADQATDLVRSTSAPFTLEVERGKEVLDINLDSKYTTDEDGEIVGIYLEDIVNVKSGFFKSIWNGFLLMGFSLTEITKALGGLISDAFSGQAELENIAGPVGIVGLVSDAAEVGIVSLITFTAFISINLAILNLAPFPALDGGRLIVILIESVTRKDLNHKAVNWVNLIGFFILIAVMIIITISDIGKLF